MTEQPHEDRLAAAFDSSIEKAPVEYVPMPEAPAPVEKSYGSETEGLREAARDLSERRQAKAPIIERSYRQIDGEHAGDPSPHNQTISLDRASRDLHNARAAENAVVEGAAAIDLAQKVDDFRADAAAERGQQQAPEPQAPQQPEPQPGPQQPELEPQPERPQADGADPELARLFENNPKLRAAVEGHLQRTETLRQEYEASISAAIGAAQQAHVAGLINAFPELAGMNLPTLQGALTLMQRQNPQRFAEFNAHVQRIQATATQLQQAQQQQAAVQQQRIAQQTKSQMQAWDDQYDRATKNDPDIKRVKAEIVNVARNHYGISEKDLAHAWQNETWIHHPAVQAMMTDAVRYRLAAAAAAYNKARPLPPVQRPGVDGDFGYVDTSGVTEAMRAFAADSTPRKAAAALIARRRAAANRR
jgi:hypothetical protein